MKYHYYITLVLLQIWIMIMYDFTSPDKCFRAGILNPWDYIVCIT